MDAGCIGYDCHCYHTVGCIDNEPYMIVILRINVRLHYIVTLITSNNFLCI